MTSSTSPGVVAYSHLEIEAAAPGRPLAILFADSDRPARPSYASLRVKGCSRILVRPASKAWYHTGVPGLGTTLEQAAAALGKIVQTLKPSHVMTFGASTGGYAAIAFGSLLQADRIVALSAELQLMLPGSRSAKDLSGPPRKFGDLLPHLHDRKPGSVWLVATEGEIVELHGAVRAAALPSVQAVAVRNTPHLTARSVDADDSWMPLFAAALNPRDQMPAIHNDGDLLNDRTAIDAAFEAYSLLNEKRAAEAERYALQASERRPDWPLAQHLLGRVLSALGRDTEAETAAGQAAALEPTQASFQYHHGFVLARLGRFPEAAEAQRAAIEHGYPGPWAHHHLGVALHRSGDHAGAEAAHRTATERSPKAPLFQHHLAIALTALNRFAEAELAARAAVSLNVENGDYLRQLARILRAQGRKDEAAETLKQAEAIDPTDVPQPRVEAEEQAPVAKSQPEPPFELPPSVAEILARAPAPQDEDADYLRKLAQITRAQERTDEPKAEEPKMEVPAGEAPAAAAPEEPPAPAEEAPAKAEPSVHLPPSVAAILSRLPRA